MWKGMGPSFSYLFLITTCFLSVLASQNPQLKYTEISPWQSLSTGSSPVKWAPVSKEDIWGWEGGISLTPLLFAGLDVCSTQDPGHKNCFGTCSSWEQPCVSSFQAEFEQPTTHPAAWRAGMVRIALTIMPTWQKILLPTQKRWREAHTRASTIPAQCPVCLAWLQWHIQIRPWTFPEAAHSSNTTAPWQPPPTAARQRDREVVPSITALLDNRRGRQRRDTGEFPPLTQLLPAHSSTYSYWFLCLTDQLWVTRCYHFALESISCFRGPHGLRELASGHVSAHLEGTATGLLESRIHSRIKGSTCLCRLSHASSVENISTPCFYFIIRPYLSGRVENHRSKPP